MGDIFDTHSHYNDSAFDSDRDELLSSLFDGALCVAVNQGTDIPSSEWGIEYSRKYKGMYAAVGLHPECLSENSFDDLEIIKKLALSPKVVAIGEIGLDYYYDIPRDLQKEIFIRQLELAAELSLPVNIHDREAHGDTLDILRRYRPKGILHCFSGSAEMAVEAVRLGMYLGFGGVVTFRNARKTVEAARAVPLENIVLETDCPYLSPEPNRGKRNDSSNIIFTAQKLAEIKGLSTEEILKVTKSNSERVYNVSI